MTVRNSKGKIIQFEYGEDGFDPMKVENQILPLVNMNLEDIYRHYDINGKDTNNNIIFTKTTLVRLKTQKIETQNKCKQYIDNMIIYREDVVKKIFQYKDDNNIRIPVGFQYIIGNIAGQLHLNYDSAIDITPLEAFHLIEEYYQKLNDIQCIKTTDLFKIMYFFFLSPKELLITKRFHRAALILLLENILLKFKEAIVHPGEMVGVVAGQSVGAPTTQLTLNTFHQAGNSSKSNVTRGVPRIEEILRLTKNPKNPSMIIYLKEIDESNQEKANYYTSIVEHTKLNDVIKSVQICFDPNEKRRPDLLLDLGSHVLIIEIDEDKHSNYDCSCENKRLMELSKDLDHRPIVFLRFNPDSYIDENNIEISSCWTYNSSGIMRVSKKKEKEWNHRIDILLRQIQYWKNNETNKTIEIVQLFY